MKPRSLLIALVLGAVAGVGIGLWPRKTVTVTEANGPPVYSFQANGGIQLIAPARPQISNEWQWVVPSVRTSFMMPETDPATNDQFLLHWHGADVLRANSNYTVFTFYSTNCVVRYLDSSNRVWTARWQEQEQKP